MAESSGAHAPRSPRLARAATVPSRTRGFARTWTSLETRTRSCSSASKNWKRWTGTKPEKTAWQGDADGSQSHGLPYLRFRRTLALDRRLSRAIAECYLARGIRPGWRCAPHRNTEALENPLDLV